MALTRSMKYLLAVVWALIVFITLVGVALAQGEGGGGETTPIDQMSDFALWSIVSGAALTYVGAFVNRVYWPDYLRFGTFFVFSLIVAAGTTYFTNSLTFDNWVRSLLLVVASGVTFYNLNKGAVKSFEARTSPPEYDRRE